MKLKYISLKIGLIHSWQIFEFNSLRSETFYEKNFILLFFWLIFKHNVYIVLSIMFSFFSKLNTLNEKIFLLLRLFIFLESSYHASYYILYFMPKKKKNSVYKKRKDFF